MALLTLLTAVAACTPERDQSELFAPEFLDILVIDAVLIVGQEIPSREIEPDSGSGCALQPGGRGRGERRHLYFH